MKATLSAHHFLRALHALAAHTHDPIDIAIDAVAKQLRLSAVVRTTGPSATTTPAWLDGSAYVSSTIEIGTLEGEPPETPSSLFHRYADVMPPVSGAGELGLTIRRMASVSGRAHDEMEITLDTFTLAIRGFPSTTPKPALTPGDRPPTAYPHDAARLAGAIGRAAEWCNKSDDSRFHLQGVLIEADNGQTAIVACDGHRMITQHVQAPWPFRPVVVHYKVARALAAFLPDSDVAMSYVPPKAEDAKRAPEDPGIRCTGGYLLMEIKSPLHGTLALTISTLDCTYPPWRLVTKPSPKVRSYTIGCAKLLRASCLGPLVEKAAHLAPAGAKIHESGEDLLLTMFLVNEHNENDNTATEHLGTFGKRGQEPVGVDPGFLHQAIVAMGDVHSGPGTVTMMLADPTDPIILDGVRLDSPLEPGSTTTKIRAVVMPRRL